MTPMDRNILLRTGEFYGDIAAAYDEMKYSVVSAFPVSAPGWYHDSFSPFFIYTVVLFVSQHREQRWLLPILIILKFSRPLCHILVTSHMIVKLIG